MPFVHIPSSKRVVQPVGRAELSGLGRLAATIYTPSLGPINLANRKNLLQLGTPLFEKARHGLSEYSPSYSARHWYEVGSRNPATDNWPGVTVLAVFVAVTTGTLVYSSLSSCVPEGDYYGGWMLSADRSGDGLYAVTFRAGNSTTPIAAAFAPNDAVVAIGSWDKNTISLSLDRNGNLSKISQSHVFAFRNAASVENIGGYSRTGYRSSPHKLALTAVFPMGFSDEQMLSLSENPWQIFAPERRVIYFPVSSVSLRRRNRLALLG